MSIEMAIAEIKLIGKWFNTRGCTVEIQYTGQPKIDIRHLSLLYLDMIKLLVESWDKCRADNVVKLDLNKPDPDWKPEK